jgi:hypothetical protein
VAKNNIYKTIVEGGLANESIFAIILQTFKELVNPYKTINESCTISDWTRMSSPTSPYLFSDGSPENINIITNLLKENKYAMFLRKVSRNFPTTALQEIMEKENDYGHQYEMLHNQALQQKNKGTWYNYNHKQIIMIGVFIMACLFGVYFL